MDTFGIVGTGVIGSGWAARSLALGWDVVAWDPAPGAEDRLRTAVNRAWPSLQRLGVTDDASPDRLRFVTTLKEVGQCATFIQESAPERLELKQNLHAELSAVTPANVVIGSSTSGLLPTDMQRDMLYPERLVVGHPFNPVYLLPLVEVVGGKQTSIEVIAEAMKVYGSLGMHALHVRNEIEGFLTDRLQEALWREILHIVNDGIATTDELDQSIVYGPGLRWAAMGTNLIYHLAGGEAGMRHMLEQFGPALELPWTKLVAPKLNDTLIDRMVEGTRAQAAGRSITDLEDMRDEYLIDVLESLERRGLSAGLTLRHHRSLTGTPSSQLFTGFASNDEVPKEVTDQSGNRYHLNSLPPSSLRAMVEDLREVLTFTLEALASIADRDWSVAANGLEFSVWETIEHMSDDLFAYAGQLSGAVVGASELRDSYAPIGYLRRSEKGPNLTIWSEPEMGSKGQIQVLAAMGGLLVSVCTASHPDTRGWHSYGLSDSEGFAAMGIIELLAHLHDIVTTFGLSISPPLAPCERAVTRLFVDRLAEVAKSFGSAEVDAWAVLLWVTGRAQLGELDRLTEWKWDGTVS